MNVGFNILSFLVTYNLIHFNCLGFRYDIVSQETFYKK